MGYNDSMKKIIASKDQFTALLADHALSNHGISTGIRTETLSGALKLKSTPVETALFQLKQTFHEKKEEFPIYRDMFIYPSFIMEIIAFTRKVIAYDIPSDTLPRRNENEKELARIVQTALSCMEWEETENRTSIQNQFAQITSDQNYCLYPHFINEPYLYEVYDSLKKTIPVITTPEVHPQVILRHGLNARQEMEAIAQDICRKGKTCNVILTSMDTQYPLLQSVFARYGIPYCTSEIIIPVHIPSVFTALLRYGVSRSVQDLQQACRVNAFGVPLDLPVQQYLFSHFTQLQTGKSIVAKMQEDAVLSHSCGLYEAMENKCTAFLEKIQPALDSIHQAEDMNEMIHACYTIMAEHPYLRDHNELKAAMQIREILSGVNEQIHTKEDISFLADYLETITVKGTYQDSPFCHVTDLTHIVPAADISYVVSVDGSSYPGVPNESGLFDEKYMEAVSGYPSQLTRNQMYISQLSWIESSATQELICSWHTNDYQGREVQLALEIEQKFGKTAEAWHLDRLSPAPLHPHTITSETAAKLFMHQGAVTGSITSVENYFRCPYQCFIQYGLHVQKPDYGSLSTNAIGNIQHSIMERSVKDFHKAYASIDEAQIRAYIDHTFALMKEASPDQVHLLDMTQERMVTGIRLTMKFLQSFENSTSFTPDQTELRFCEEIIDGVILTGVIDRLDLYGKEFLRIIDYKSTGYSLSETKVKACVQLQLLTYAMIAQKLYGITPAGVYYCSFRSETYDVPAMTKGRKEIIETDFSDEAEEERMMNQRTLKGWTFTDRTVEMDETGTHIATLKKQKDFELIRACMQEIYSIFLSRIKQGDISLSPDESACGFCSFRPICRYHGEYRKQNPLVFQDVKFSVGKD